MSNKDDLVIAVVGPCAAGKSGLAESLRAAGFSARQIVQEHSYVSEMWRIITKPDYLIYLDASFDTCSSRKKLNWTQSDYDEQTRRLRHAREHCDLHLATDQLSPVQVFEEALLALGSRDLRPG